jgi:hypothetical protein
MWKTTPDASIADLLVAFRRAQNAGDDVTAAELAVRISDLEGEPLDDAEPLGVDD